MKNLRPPSAAGLLHCASAACALLAIALYEALPRHLTAYGLEPAAFAAQLGSAAIGFVFASIVVIKGRTTAVVWLAICSFVLVRQLII
jgi:hypothetical protein